jgi:hypothetical protein
LQFDFFFLFLLLAAEQSLLLQQKMQQQWLQQGHRSLVGCLLHIFVVVTNEALTLSGRLGKI